MKNEDYRDITLLDLQNNETIYQYLRRNGYSENYTKNLRKQKGLIKINGEMVFINYKPKKNDLLSIHKNPFSSTSVYNCNIPLDIVFEDDEILIINKPSNLATMPTRSHYNNNLTGAVCNYINRPDFVCRIINRLDKDTAGLVLVAKNSLSANFLALKSKIEKEYYALITGKLTQYVKIDKKIFTEIIDGKITNKRIVSDVSGKEAITHAYPIHVFDHYTLIKLIIENGRTHQIRAHMSSIEHPLLGDKLYGNESEIINHTALVCKKISLIHPTTFEKLTFEINFPEDFKRLIN